MVNIIRMAVTFGAFGTFLNGLIYDQFIGRSLDLLYGPTYWTPVYNGLGLFFLLVFVCTYKLEWHNLLLPFLAFLYFVLAFLKMQMNSHVGGSLALGTYGVRILAPIGLYFIVEKNKAMLFWRVGLALTFFSHGIECLLLRPLFLDFINFYLNILLPSVSDLWVERMCLGIGIIDVVCALGVLFYMKLPLLCYMSFWGLTTAFMRLGFWGEAGLGLFLERLIHSALPFALIFNTNYSLRRGICEFLSYYSFGKSKQILNTSE